MDVTIRDYIGYEKELTAEEIRKLPIGTTVVKHSFDRYGAHQTLEMWVVQRGRSRALNYRDGYGMLQTVKIAKETDRMCYTEGKR